MPGSTSRLSLALPLGSDAPSEYRVGITANANTLDAAAMWQSGTLASKPSASSVPAGTVYFATDTAAMLVSIGGAWVWPFANSVPVGTIASSATIAPPADPDGVQRWHVCDGSTVGRSANPALNTLMSAAGYPWGAGDGSTTLNLPDLRGRTLICRGSGAGLSTRTIAGTGGEETHLLTDAESGTNGNGVTGTESATHEHNFTAVVAGGSGLSGTGSGAGTRTENTGTESPSHIHDLVARDADDAHNNMQPFAVVNYIIKIA